MSGPAADFPAHLEWANTAAPLRLDDDLRDRVVILVFWSSSCVHSLHMLRALDELESAWAHRPVSVVGVHVGRYPVEDDAATVRRTVARLELPFPTAIDGQHLMWDDYGCEAWPTLVVIDHTGEIRFQGSGELDAERLAEAIGELAELAESEGAIGSPLPLDLEAIATPGELAFPSKLTVDPESGWLWIADSGHHRLVAVDAEGHLTATVGCGRWGARDGDFERACFAAPQGLAVRDGMLFVADSGNHAIRRVDIRAGEVSTLVGTGELAHDPHGGKPGKMQGLASPWDVALDGEVLRVAMAGGHSLWAVGVHAGVATPGPARLVQPMAVACLGDDLVVAESVRNTVSLVTDGGTRAETLVGQGPFEFGDADGALHEARLQCPRGIAVCDGEVWIADTLNDAIRRCDAEHTRLETVPIGSFALSGPEGLAVHDGTLFVADTGNHRVLALDLESHEARELPVQ